MPKTPTAHAGTRRSITNVLKNDVAERHDRGSRKCAVPHPRQRLSVGFSSFLPHHVLHNNDGRLGTFSLPAPDAMARMARVLFGAKSMLIPT